jgi:hypothetical protein
VAFAAGVPEGGVEPGVGNVVAGDGDGLAEGVGLAPAAGVSRVVGLGLVAGVGLLSGRAPGVLEGVLPGAVAGRGVADVSAGVGLISAEPGVFSPVIGVTSELGVSVTGLLLVGVPPAAGVVPGVSSVAAGVLSFLRRRRSGISVGTNGVASAAGVFTGVTDGVGDGALS